MTKYDITGKYKVSNGKIAFTNMVKQFEDGDKRSHPNTVVEYKFEKYSDGKEYLKIGLVDYGDTMSYVPISSGWSFDKR